MPGANAMRVSHFPNANAGSVRPAQIRKAIALKGESIAVSEDSWDFRLPEARVFEPA
jgi:hypothetical protein